MDSSRRLGPRLRTTTGCFMCRKRRKKCNEQKPRCAGCARQDFQCVWPAPRSIVKEISHEEVSFMNARSQEDLERMSTSPFADDSTKLGCVRSATYGLPGIRTSMDHHLSLYLRERFLPVVLRANAHSAFHDWRHLITVGTETSTTMSAFLATAAMHASRTNPKLKPVATRYYNSAITGLRKAIADGEADGGEDWLLHTTNFLCLFEWMWIFQINQGWNTGRNPSGAAPHLDGLAQILKIRIAQDSGRSKEFVHPQNRIAAESFVFFVSTLSLYYSDIDCISDTINWDDLRLYLEPDVFPGASVHANSPILGQDWMLYRTIFEITRLGHKVPLDSAEYAHGQELELELHGREQDLHQDIEKLDSRGQMEDVLWQTLLYILVSQILIFKTLRPETRTCHKRIRKLVADAMSIVRGLSIEPKCPPYFCWPLAILSCAIEVEEDMLVLRDALEKVWQVSYCGEVQRVRRAVEVFWQRVDMNGDDRGFNLLDMLVFRRGMFNHPCLASQWGTPP